jgi:putative ATPase
MEQYAENKFSKPLAERMRPTKLDEFIGQNHLINKNSLLSRAIRTNSFGNCIFYGPPGCGKTTLANIIANTCKGNFVKLNAISSGVGDAKEVIEKAKNDKQFYGTQTYLLLDECHRWSKSQSDSILEAMEDGSIIFIGSTTENPYFSMTRAIVSRCRVFEFKSLNKDDVIIALTRAINDKDKGLGMLNIDVKQDAIEHIAEFACGDIRSALNALELAVLSTPMDKNGKIIVDLSVAEESIQKKALSVDESEYYDMLSAFCKSLRGSDADAALFYAQRLIKSGCDPQIIARRLIAHSSEDVGMADSNALLLSICALIAVKELGMPECNLALSHAIIYVCEADKSNSVLIAKENAEKDAESLGKCVVPPYLKNNDNLEDENPKGYKYPHNYGGYVKQQYLPNELKDRIYYKPLKNGREKNLIRKKVF